MDDHCLRLGVAVRCRVMLLTSAEPWLSLGEDRGEATRLAGPDEAVSRLAQACYYPCPLPRRDTRVGSIRGVRGTLS
jgi:hypothetical protein